MEQLLDIIGAGSFNDSGLVVARVETWDGKTIEGAYGQKPNEKFLVGDVETDEDIFYDVEPIRPFAERLLKTGESFFTVCGTSDMVCSLEWRLTS